MIPVIIPEKRDAPEARAIPKQRGRATKNTTRPGRNVGTNPFNANFR
jgi:hypothetical protein